jgi:uncharacterized membrane protein
MILTILVVLAFVLGWSLCRAAKRVPPALALLLLLSAAPCAAQSKVSVSLGIYTTLSVVDLSQTQRALGTGRYIEANPAMAWATKPESMAIVKVAGTAAVVACILKVRKSHPKAALALALTSVAIQGAVVIHNGRTVR